MNTSPHRIFGILLMLCLGGLFAAPSVHAQSFDLGANVTSRYVWRGLDFGNAAAIQPSLSFSSGGLTLGAWGSFEMSPLGGPGVNENDLYASYAYETSTGTFSVSVTDYYFTIPNSDFFDYGRNGAHIIEPSVTYSGPFSLSTSINAHGADSEVWLEARYPFSLNEVDLSVGVGGTPNDGSGYYGTDADTDVALTKLSLSATKSLEITESFSLPISASYYVNPYLARSYILFGISI